MIVEAQSREKVQGNITMTGQGRTITIDITGKWLNATCGAVQ